MMHFLDIALTISSVLLVIALLITIPVGLAWKLSKPENTELKWIAITCFSITFGLGFLLFSLNITLKSLARTEVEKIIQSIPDHSLTTVNGKLVNSSEILAELRKIKWVAAHNSHPTERFVVLIHDINLVFEIWLERDSARNSEFWVFYPKYRHTRLNSFARIKTDYFETKAE